jgi:predicted transposase YbfD/YdcC
MGAGIMGAKREKTMPPKSPTSISQYFDGVVDPRTGQNVQHPLLNIITIAICGIICGADTWVDIEMYGNAKSVWLATFLDLRHGIPSHDTFGRVFRYINPEEFQACFQEWTTAICERTEGEVMAVDGKYVRRSKDGTLGKDAIQMVSIWASENELVLAQEKVDEGTNEITTIPHLLRLFDLEGGVVTVDAIGCQTDIAEAVIGQRADYVLAVKDNQETLRHDIASIFEQFPPFIQPDYHKTVNKGHGRIEIRECWAVSHPEVLAYLKDYKEWKSLQSIVKVVAERRIGNDTTLSTRYFITSLPANARHLLHVVRTHWHIENRLHWVLDIAFREDESRVRKDHAPHNLTILRHIALNLLKQESSLKVGVKAKRLRAGWDEDYLLKVLSTA